jgi:flagellin-like protein
MSTHRDPGSRGQSSPIGYVLIFGITIAAAVAIVTFGAVALDDIQQDSSVRQAEQAMTQFDSQAAQVALGDSTSKSIALGRGDYRVNETAGTVTIRHENWDNNGASEEILPPTDVGMVTYERGDTTIAYQGGGVWRQDPQGDAQMISPPEFHYSGSTLTFPLITVQGDAARNGDSRISVSKLSSSDIFPDGSSTYDGSTDPYENPTQNGSILVDIESDYCTGWQSYFAGRSEGVIKERCGEGQQGRVTVDLTVPLNENFENVITVTDEYDSKGKNDDQNFVRANKPSVSSAVEEKSADCQNNGCSDLSTALGSTVDDGTYYASGDVSFNGETFDTTNGNITMIIDGHLTISGSNDITGDGEVRVYTRKAYVLQDSINQGGLARQLQIYVHSNADQIEHKGNSHLTGVVYAPNTDFEQRGSGVVKGAIIGETVTVRGNPSNTFQTDSSLDDFEADILDARDPITFLHITENEIQVDLS